MCSCCPSLSLSLLIEPRDVEYVSAVFFCLFFWILCCVVCGKKNKKLLITKKKKEVYCSQGHFCWSGEIIAI